MTYSFAREVLLDALIAQSFSPASIYLIGGGTKNRMDYTCK
ncbi:hypothetical protein ACL2XP_11720 [Sodalis sp. RH21]